MLLPLLAEFLILVNPMVVRRRKYFLASFHICDEKWEGGWGAFIDLQTLSRRWPFFP